MTVTQKVYPRVLVYGGRDYKAGMFLNDCLDALVTRFKTQYMVIEGGALGADTMAGNWAKGLGYPHACVEANWEFYKNSAGPVRNSWMGNFIQPHFGVEFPGGKGTADMHKRLVAANVPIWVPEVDEDIPESFSLERLRNEVSGGTPQGNVSVS